MASLQTNINQVNSDFQKIKAALIDSGVEVADGTRTSEYGKKVRDLYEAGQKSMVDESKIIKKTITGTGWVMVDDVSEIPHDVNIKVENLEHTEDLSWGSIDVLGKNLLNPNTLYGDVTFEVDSDIISMTTTKEGANAYFSVNNYQKYVGKTITMSFYVTEFGGTEQNAFYVFMYADAAEITRIQCTKNTSRVISTFTVPENTTAEKLIVRFYVGYAFYIGETLTIKDFQLELGETATTYEPYKDIISYPLNSNGETVVKSVSPNMTVLTDAYDITVSYHKSYGMQTEYDRFWDLYQNNGNRTNYSYAFGGIGWTTDTFKPKYNINATASYEMFRSCALKLDLVELLDDLGITLDTSNCTSIGNMYYQSNFTRIGEVSATANKSLANVFAATPNLVTIDKFILKSDGTNTFSSVFNNSNALENITIEGVIGNDFDIHWSPLTHDSLMSIINHLQDKTGASTKPILTIGTTNYNKLTAEEIKIATDKGWEVV